MGEYAYVLRPISAIWWGESSGIGREFSDAFIEDYTELKSVMIRY